MFTTNFEKVAKEKIKGGRADGEPIEKKSADRVSNVYRGLEHAGLGALMAPSVYNLAKGKQKHQTKNEHKKEKLKDIAEVGGLGTLMGAVEVAHKGTPLNKLVTKMVTKK